jgi:C4-type Zn-finger protein
VNRVCPRCGHRTMKPHGKIRGGPRNGLRKVFRCTNCGYQSMQAKVCAVRVAAQKKLNRAQRVRRTPYRRRKVNVW